MFQQLVKFKNENGHTNVPQRSPKYSELATWVHNQRAAKQNNRPVIAIRGKRLDEIGFAWRLVGHDAWEIMLERLVDFKKVHGHCNVPQKGGGDKRLGKWVNTQRTHFKRGDLKPDRIRQLEEVGFVWNTKGNRVETEVLGGGLEPPCLTAYAPQTYVSAISPPEQLGMRGKTYRRRIFWQG